MRLRTIGGLWIEGESLSFGPRPLALLAVAASAGSKGLSRERLIGILWAETGEEQARHTLSQTLYGLRKSAGRDLIIGSTQLRLDPSIESDIGELRAALSVGDLETVARLYSGDFLDAFYLPGAPEFERWVEEERTALRADALRAIERLAKNADEADPPTTSVRWWHRLTELDPLSARYAAGHIRALAGSGDHSGALALARRHREVVHRELGVEPDLEIQKLEAFLRTAPASSSIKTDASPNPAPAPPLPSKPTPETHRARWLVPGILAGIVVLGLMIRSLARAEPEILAVGAIRTPELGDTSSFGPILRDMLATSLGGVGGLQVVSNSRLIELMSPGSEPTPGATTNAARRAGATETLEGELTTDAGALVLSLRRVRLDRGVVRRGYLVRADNRYALVDSAAAVIARDLGLAPPSQPVREVRTSSPEAYALYHEGLRAFYGYDAPAAYRLMTAALERDSTFAMASYYAWEVGRALGNPFTREGEFERVKRLAHHTIEPERLLIQAKAAAVEAPLSVTAAIVETLTVRYPTNPDGQILLGEVRFNQGDPAGSVAAYARAVEIDSAAGASKGSFCRMCLAFTRMAEAYVWWDSAGAAERVSRRAIRVRPDDPGQWGNLVEPLLRQRRRTEAEQAIEKSGPGGAVSAWNPVLHRDLLRWGRFEELDRQLATDLQAPSHNTRADAHWLLMLSLRDQGRLREILDMTRQSRVPGSVDLLIGASLLMESGHPDSAARLFHGEARRLLSSTNMLRGLQARTSVWQLTLAATAYLAAGDTVAVRRLADSVEAIGQRSSYGRDPRLHHFLRGILLQHEGRHLEALNHLQASIFSLTDGYSRTNLAMARSLLILHRPAEAVAVLRPAIHGGVDGSNSYTSRTELHEAMAEAFEQAGQRDSATAHWRAVESAWRHADPQFQDRYQRAKLKAGL